MSSPEGYSPDEVEEVLRLALQRRKGAELLTHEELLELGRDVGIDRSAMEAAAREVSVARTREALARQLQAHRWRAFRGHLTAYLIVNAGLTALAAVLGAPILALLPLLGWGIGVAFHLVALARKPDPEHLEEFARELQQRKERDQRREQRNARRRERRASKAREKAEQVRADQERDAARRKLEEAMHKGVNALLEKAAQSIESAASKLSDSDARPSAPPASNEEMDFGAYVAGKRAGKAKPAAPAEEERTGVRVHPQAEPAEPRGEERASREAEASQKARRA